MRRIGTLGVLVAAAVVMTGCATITMLPDGQLLLISGVAKLYDPATGISTLTGAPATPRIGHTATLLKDGRTLVAGGIADDDLLASAELYDPSTGTFTPTGDMSEGRSMHAATLLQDGRVLVTGGGSVSSTSGQTAPPINTAEVYDPATGTFTPVGAMADARAMHGQVMLPDERVLVIGGSGATLPLASAEIFDPKSGQFTATGSLSTPRTLSTATALEDGKVMVIGGVAGQIDTSGGSGGDAFLSSTELYDPGTGVFTAAADLGVPRAGHSATRLLDGRILVAGGIDPALTGYATAEIYDPATDSFSATGSMSMVRFLQAAELLPDGRVLVAGAIDPAAGGATTDLLMNVEIWDPATGTFTLQELVPAPVPSPT